MSSPTVESRIADGDDLRARLLRAARVDRVPEGARTHAVNAALATRSIATIASRGALRSLAAKLLLGTVLALGGDTASLTEDARHAFEAVPARATSATSVTREDAIAPDTTLPVFPAKPPSARPVREAQATKIDSAPAPTLADEVAALDDVRASLRRGDPADALVKLARYDHMFSPGQLVREATLLRIEALEKRGNHAAALALARAFLRANPATPLAQRIQSLVGRESFDSQPDITPDLTRDLPNQ